MFYILLWFSLKIFPELYLVGRSLGEKGLCDLALSRSLVILKTFIQIFSIYS